MWEKSRFYLPETMNWFQKHTILLFQCNSGVEWINLQSATKPISQHHRSFHITNWKVFPSLPLQSAQSQMMKSVTVEENFNPQIQVKKLTFCGPVWIRPPACTWSQIYQEGKQAHCPSLIKSCHRVLWSLCCKGNENTLGTEIIPRKSLKQEASKNALHGYKECFLTNNFLANKGPGWFVLSLSITWTYSSGNFPNFCLNKPNVFLFNMSVWKSWPHLDSLPSISSNLWIRLMARLYISGEMEGLS